MASAALEPGRLPTRCASRSLIVSHRGVPSLDRQLSITRQDQVQSDIAQPRYRRVSTTALGPR